MGDLDVMQYAVHATVALTTSTRLRCATYCMLRGSCIIIKSHVTFLYITNFLATFYLCVFNKRSIREQRSTQHSDACYDGTKNRVALFCTLLSIVFLRLIKKKDGGARRDRFRCVCSLKLLFYEYFTSNRRDRAPTRCDDSPSPVAARSVAQLTCGTSFRNGVVDFESALRLPLQWPAAPGDTLSLSCTTAIHVCGVVAVACFLRRHAALQYNSRADCHLRALAYALAEMLDALPLASHPWSALPLLNTRLSAGAAHLPNINKRKCHLWSDGRTAKSAGSCVHAMHQSPACYNRLRWHFWISVVGVALVCGTRKHSRLVMNGWRMWAALSQTTMKWLGKEVLCRDNPLFIKFNVC